MPGNQNFIVAIDGPAGSGKSTVAKMVALHFDIPYIDTGSMYRTLAWRAHQKGIGWDSVPELEKIAESAEFRFGFDQAKKVEIFCKFPEESELKMGNEIRSQEVSMGASRVAVHSPIRKILVSKQQAIGRSRGGVLEGRDAGTVIFPDAKFKFFLTARAEVRAQRRLEQLQESGIENCPSYEEVLADVKRRDEQDSQREASPMKPAEDAQILDTSDYRIEEVFDMICKEINSLRVGAHSH